MEIIIAAIAGLILVFFFWEFPAFTIIAVILIVAVASCSDIEIKDTVEAGLEDIFPIDKTKETPETPETPKVENSVKEQCLDGIVYLLVVDNGQSFMAPKEDTFGYNVKCSE